MIDMTGERKRNTIPALAFSATLILLIGISYFAERSFKPTRSQVRKIEAYTDSVVVAVKFHPDSAAVFRVMPYGDTAVIGIGNGVVVKVGAQRIMRR